MVKSLSSFPLRSNDGEHARLLDFAREATVLLVDAFAPPQTVHDQREETVPYGHEEWRSRVGDREHGFEIVHRTDHVEAGSRTLSADTVSVQAYGLPDGTELFVEIVRPPNHPSFLRTVRLVAGGPDDRTERVLAAFRSAFPGDDLRDEELDVAIDLARSYLREPMWAEAIRYARAVLRAREADPGARLVLGIGLAATEHPEAAEEQLASVVRVVPSSFDAWYNLGRLRWESDRVESAAECFEAAIAADPDNHPSHFMLGCCLEKMGQRDAAISAYEKAAATSPNPHGAWGHQGMDFGEQARSALARLRTS